MSAVALRLATRASTLARVQTGIAAAALAGRGAPQAEVVLIHPTGDRDSATPVTELAGVGWFTNELERALIEGRADAAVHSAKDLPDRLGPGLEVAALLARADPRDAAVTRDGRRLEELPAGAVVATSSPRREALIRDRHPHLRVRPIRGNVDTRLRRLDAGEIDCLILACAGLDRLGVGDRGIERLDPQEFVPAPAQGVIAVEALTESPFAEVCRRVTDPDSSAAVAAERAVLRGLGGGCLLPLGAWATVDAGQLSLVAVLAADGRLRRAGERGGAADAAEIGAEVARRLR